MFYVGNIARIIFKLRLVQIAGMDFIDGRKEDDQRSDKKADL
jgi:hypothetical protein